MRSKRSTSSYSGSTVAPLQNSGLVNTGNTDTGPMDVFSVFDSFTVTNVGLSHAHAKGASRQKSTLGHGTTAAGRADRLRMSLLEGSATVSGSAAGDGLAQPLPRPAPRRIPPLTRFSACFRTQIRATHSSATWHSSRSGRALVRHGGARRFNDGQQGAAEPQPPRSFNPEPTATALTHSPSLDGRRRRRLRVNDVLPPRELRRVHRIGALVERIDTKRIPTE